MNLPLPALIATMASEARAHRTRSLALTVTVALGAALMAASMVLGASLRDSVDQGMGVEYAGSQVQVTSDGLDQGDVDRLVALEGVAEVGTHTSTWAVAQVEGETRGIMVDSVASATPFIWQRWSNGRAPTKETEVALTERALDELHIKVGDQVALGKAGVDRVNFTVVGEIDARGSSRHTSVAYAIVIPSVAHSLAGTTGDNIALLTLADGSDARTVAATVNESGTLGEARTTEDLAALGAGADRLHDASGLTTGFGSLAFFVAALALAAVTMISLEGRRKFLALFQDAGATRTEAASVVVLETLVLGAGGAVVGVGIGVALSLGAVRLVGLDAFAMSTGAVVGPIVVALVLAALAGLVPATLATRTRPLRARSVTAWGVLGGVLAAMGILVALRADGSGGLLLGVVALSCGVLALLPAVIRQVATSAHKLGFVRRDPARSLSTGWLSEQPVRAAGEVLALVVACALISFSWVALGSVEASTDTRLSDSTAPDLVLGEPNAASPIGEEALAALADVDGVDQVTAIPFGQKVSLRGKDASGKATSFTVGTVAGDVDELDRSLPGDFPLRTIEEETVYLPASSTLPFADGSKVSMKGPDRTVKNLAVVRVEGLGLPSVASINQVFQVTQFNDDRLAWISLDPDADPAVVLEKAAGVALLESDVAVGGVLLDDLRIHAAVDAARAASLAFLSLAILAAVVALVTAGALSVRERNREHAVLRAIGLEWLGLKHLALLRALVGAVVGVGVGLPLGAFLAIQTGRVSATALGATPEISVTWLPIIVLLVLVLGAVRAACAIPLERASLFRPARALASE